MDIDWFSDKYFVKRFDHDQTKTSLQLDPAWFPGLYTSSPAFFWNFVYRPKNNRSPEFVYVPFRKRKSVGDLTEEDKMIYRWNLTWESGHLRADIFSGHLPLKLDWLIKFTESNVYLLPDSQPKYEAYSPLYHLLPQSSIVRFSLPLYLRGEWPVSLAYSDEWFSLLTHDFEDRLSQAFAHHIWPLLFQRSPLSALSKNDPIVILSHKLDFWLPYAYQVIEQRLCKLPRCEFENTDQVGTLLRLRSEAPPGTNVYLPRKGGDIWAGESDAWKAAQELVEAADRQGKLRSVIDAVLSHRVVDDFSGRWSFEREDFEKQFYHKRSKVQVAFVELDDTVPVHGPDSEVEEDLLWEDFIALLNPKERQIVVCLRNGTTKLGDIGRKLGYANHSPVSKALKKIRAKAKQYLEI